MKNLLIIFTLFLVNTAFAQDTYYLLEGRPDAMETVQTLVVNLKQDNYPVIPQPNVTAGEYFYLSFIQNGKEIAKEKVSLSTTIVKKIKKHLKNGRTGEQLAQVCGTQVGQFSRVFRSGYGTHTQNNDTCDTCDILAEQNTKIDVLHGDVQSVKRDTEQLLGGQNAIYAQTVANGDYAQCSFEANIKIREVVDRYRDAHAIQFYGVGKANRELDELKQLYPCIPADFTIERANKLVRDGVDLLNLGLNAYTAVKVSQPRTVNNYYGYDFPQGNPNTNPGYIPGDSGGQNNNNGNTNNGGATNNGGPQNPGDETGNRAVNGGQNLLHPNTQNRTFIISGSNY